MLVAKDFQVSDIITISPEAFLRSDRHLDNSSRQWNTGR